jgi:hypothetical protein
MCKSTQSVVLAVFVSLRVQNLHRLRVCENRVLGRIFGPKSDEVTGESRGLHSEEHRDVYSPQNIFRVIK